MNYYGTSFWAPTDLEHHGIKGQKWGVRRWQNADGTFNEAGKRRYFGDGSGENYKSVSGNARRAIAKIYDINERYYSKRGNKVMASMNKSAKENMLKRAEEADRKKINKKTSKIETRVSKKMERSEKYDKYISSARSKNEERLIAKYDKLVAQGKITRERANAKIEDFRIGTKAINQGASAYNSIIKNWGNAKVKALNDTSYKKTQEYKQAGKEYARLTFLEGEGTQSYAKLYYASQEAIKLLEEKPD